MSNWDGVAWAQIISAIITLLAVGGFVVTPRLRRQVRAQTDVSASQAVVNAAQADLLRVEKREKEIQMHLEVLNESHTRALADISQLKADRDTYRQQAEDFRTALQKVSQQHEQDVERLERRILRLMTENEGLRTERDALREELRRCQQKPGGESR